MLYISKKYSKKMKTSKVLLLLIIPSIFIFSCKKKEDKKGCTDSSAQNYNADATIDDASCTYAYNASTEYNAAESASGNMTTAAYEDVMLFTSVQYETDNDQALHKMLSQTVTPIPSCASINTSLVGIGLWPKKLTIDYGNSNCLCDDGKYRRGKVEAIINDNWLTSGGGVKDSMTITLVNYYVNDTMLTGTRTFIKESASASKLVVSAVVIDAGVIYPSNDTIKWNYTGSLTLGFGDKLDYTDNTVGLFINGSIDNKGTVYTVETPDTLSAVLSCLSTCIFTKGTLKLSTTDAETVHLGNKDYQANVTTTGTLNFGTGTCDGSIDLSLNVTGIEVTNSKQLFSETTTETMTCDDFTDWE